MAWIEAHQSLERHPKTFDLMNQMGWDLDMAVGKLFRFWWWCVDYAEDGDLRKHNDGTIASAVGLNGEEGKRFVQAMLVSRWIEREPYFRVRNWWKYFGSFLKIKYRKKPDKWRRIQKLYEDSVQDTVQDSVQDSKPNQPNLTNQPSDFDPSTGMPLDEIDDGIRLPFQSEAFRAAWRQWLEYQAGGKRAMNVMTKRAQLEECREWGESRSIAAIAASIKAGWKGLFEGKDSPKQNRAPTSAVAVRKDR